jgi:hypothetical protein
VVKPRVLVGYAHASVVESMRPDIAYPNRKVRAARSAFLEVTAVRCDCPEGHIEVWASDAH